MKTLNQISWQVTEPEYRADPALSYSTLAKYERGGYNVIPTLFDKVESESLTFGSAVDAIITGGEEEFNQHFVVMSINLPTDGAKKVADVLVEEYGDKYPIMDSIPNEDLVMMCQTLGYCAKYTPAFIAKNIREKATEYYDQSVKSKGKTVISEDTYSKVVAAVNALRTSEATKWYFGTPDTKDVKRYYQLKFKGDLDGIPFRCMADLILVDYKNKKIYPVDLKTSSHFEWEFQKSFKDWQYQIQARAYARLIKQACEADDYFKDFEIANYVFVVVNKETLRPLAWEFDKTFIQGDIAYGRYGNNFFRDPADIAKELTFYLSNPNELPTGVTEMRPNSITEWLNRA